jgi:hypothetical protein
LFTSTSRRPKVETLCSVCLDCDGFSAAEFNRFDYGRGWAPVLRIGEDYAWSIGGQHASQSVHQCPGKAGNECHFANLDIESPLFSRNNFRSRFW